MLRMHVVANAHHSRSLHCVFRGEQCLGIGPVDVFV